MESHVPRPPLCHILLLLTTVILSLLSQVSGRAAIIRSAVLTESADELEKADAVAIDDSVSARQRRDLGSLDHIAVEHSQAHAQAHSHAQAQPHSHAQAQQHTQFLCPPEYQGVNYQCLDHSICQPHDVWQGAACAGSSHQVCCRVGLGTASAVSGGGSQQGHVDYYSLPRNLMTQLINQEAMDMIKTYTPHLRCGAKSPIKSYQCLHRGRIASGNEDAETCFGEWPWHVALLEKQRHKCSKSTLSDYDRWRLRCHIVHPVDLYRYICGGTIISANHVITSAHCVKGVRQDRLKLHLGDYNLYSSARELLPEIQRHVIEAHIHEGYDPYTYEDDLAILTLDKAVDFRLTPHIGPACLPSAHHEFIENAHCTIVGWGEDPYKPNHGSNILKSVDVTIGTEEECEDRLGQSFTLGRHQLCIVGNLGTDACLGDGGGAVVCPMKADANYGKHYRGSENAPDQYFMAGIISWGSDSCGESSVTVINLIEPYLNWIGVKTAPPRQYYGNQQHGNQHSGNSNCQFNQFFRTVEASGYGSLAQKHLTLTDISCVFGEQFTNNPSYKIWYDSVYGHGAGTVQGTGFSGAGTLGHGNIGHGNIGHGNIGHGSLGAGSLGHGTLGHGNIGPGNIGAGNIGIGVPTSSTNPLCQANPFLQKVEAGGYVAITGMSLSLQDIKCVFGEEFTANPNYKVWFDTVHGTNTGTGAGTGVLTPGTSTLGIGVPSSSTNPLCQANSFLQKVEFGGYVAITGMSLALEDIKCVFGEEFTANPNYKVWFDTVHGAVGGVTVAEQGAIVELTSAAISTTANQGIGVFTTAGIADSCRDNKFFIKVEANGYSAVAGAVMAVEDLKCVFGEDFTKNPNYNQYFVSVYCIQRGPAQIPAVCCQATNFNQAACCGLGKHNPPGQC